MTKITFFCFEFRILVFGICLGFRISDSDIMRRLKEMGDPFTEID
jgi:hypothetical protein